MEHAFQFRCELVAAFYFQLGEHAPFRVVRNRTSKEKTLREMALVVAFEYVLLRDVSEDRDRLVENDFNLSV